MLEIEFDREQSIPVVIARVVGPRKSLQARLVFDTGSELSQLDTGLVEDIGYSASSGTGLIHLQSAVGESQTGYLVALDQLLVFNRRFEGACVGVYDFDNFSHHGIDGLLGWDIIRQLHLEMDGPGGLLRVF